MPIQPYGTIENLIVDYSDDAYIAFHFSTDEQKWQVLFSQKDSNKKTPHEIEFKNKDYAWSGPLKIIKTSK